MIISLFYTSPKSSRRVKKEVKKSLGVKSKNKMAFEYDGMLISFGEKCLRINTLMDDDKNWGFLERIILEVLPNSSIGISGFLGDHSSLDKKVPNIQWM